MDEEEQVEFEPLGEGQELVDEEDGLTNEQADKILNELKTGERIFEYNGDNYKIVNPNVKIGQQADWEYSRAFNNALEMGLPIQEELEEKLVKKGILLPAEEHEVKNKESRQELERLEEKLKLLMKTSNEKEKKRIATKLAKERTTLYMSLTKRMGYLSNSVEAKAEDARNGFIISQCTFFADINERVWKSYDEYLDETNRLLLNKIAYEYISFTSGVSLNFMQEFPEVKVLEGQA